MGRKRTRQTETDDSDSDVETIVVDKRQGYSLRPRKAQLFTEDLIDEEETEYVSDFEDELNNRGRKVKTVSYGNKHSEEEEEITEVTDSIDYDELITAGIVVNEHHVDYEKVIEKTEIKVHKRKTEDSSPESSPKRRGRKRKWQTEKEKAIREEGGNGEFCHFLDTQDSIAENIPNLGISSSVDSGENSLEPSELVASILDEHSDQKDTDTNAQFDSETNDNNTAIENDTQQCSNNTVNGDITHTETPNSNNSPIEIDDNVATPKASDNNVIQIADDDDSNDKASPKDNTQNWTCIIHSMNDESYFVECDEEVAVLKEKLPKARFHYLLVPKENIRSLSELSERHLPMIKHLHETANRIVKYPQHEDCTFKIGFNAQPTMIIYNQKFLWLHLHVISDDMISEDMLLKKHWNSINSKLFVSPEDVIKELTEHGKVVSLPSLDECRDILNGDIKCHKCDFVTPKFSAIKKHIRKEHSS